MAEKTMPQPDESFAGNSGQGIQKHSERINRFGERRKRAAMFQRWLADHNDLTHREDLQRVSADLRQCASWLKFNHYYRVDEVRLAAAYTCKRHLVCPFCAARRASKQVERYLDRLRVILTDNPRLKLALLTFTVKNGDDLAERHAHLENSFRRLQKKRRDALQGKGKTELSKVAGAFFSYEVTNKNQGKGWHPHIHCLVLLDEYIVHSKLVTEWEKITGDSIIVDIRRIAGGISQIIDQSGQIVPEIVDAFAEVFKYALKFSELSFQHNLEAFELLRGKRLQGSFGLFWGVKVPESHLDDLLDNEPYIELFYRFNGKAYDLTKTRRSTADRIGGHLKRAWGAPVPFIGDSLTD
ncbi:Replication protein (plasmid) [Halomonas sp. NYA30]